MYRRTRLAAALSFLLTLGLSGCVQRYTIDAPVRAQLEQADALELSAVPFFPQARYQCGPAALATVLVHSGVSTTPDALVSQVYIPDLKGSLQAEMVSASRRADRIPVRTAGDLASIKAELDAGHPVLVLLNLAVPWYPMWHYAVVVGYDPSEQRLLLRSGTTERESVDFAVFNQQWQQAGAWGIVTLPPGELPGSDVPSHYLSAVAGLEAAGRLAQAEAAYRAGIQRWPARAELTLGLANVQYASGNYEAMRETLERLVETGVEHPVALNNLAQLEIESGCRERALALAERALEAAPERLRANIADTRDTAAGLPPGRCPQPVP